MLVQKTDVWWTWVRWIHQGAVGRKEKLLLEKKLSKFKNYTRLFFQFKAISKILTDFEAKFGGMKRSERRILHENFCPNSQFTKRHLYERRGECTSWILKIFKTRSSLFFYRFFNFTIFQKQENTSHSNNLISFSLQKEGDETFHYLNE